MKFSLMNMNVGERMLTKNLLWSVILYFIQPIFIIGLLYAVYNRNQRVSYSREKFRVNFNRENFEVKDFLLKGVLPGVLLSVLSVLIGIPVTIEWYLVYQVLTIVLLLIGGSRFIHPVLTFSLSAIVLYGLNFIGVNLPLGWLSNLGGQEMFTFGETMGNLPNLTRNLLLLATIILFTSTFILDKKDDYKTFPTLKSSKRGKMVAKYQKKSLWILPLLVIVPGEVVEPFATWWPLLNIHGEQYAFLFLPILVGLHYTVSTQLLEEATLKLQKEFRYLAMLGLALFVASYFVPMMSLVGVVILLLGGLWILIRHRQRENMWNFRYGPADEGLRVIAVRKDSPAERLDLSIGDIILNLNEHELIDTAEYNKVLSANRSYAKMRIRRKDGEIVIAETPLYDDDYNNLGLLLLEK